MAGLKYEFVDVTDDNVCEVGLFCQKSKYKEKGYQGKLGWFKEQYKKGLRTKLVGFKNDKKRFVLVGFIEYAPGEHAWRGIDAKGWMVIHCLWIIGKHKGQGLGSKLLEECAKDAKKNGLNGIVAMTSRMHWLANEKLFLKNGFKKVDEMPPFGLYAKKLKSNVASPKFYPVSLEKLASYGKELTILESHQCPYSHKTVTSIKLMAERTKTSVRVEHIANCEEAQKNAVHPYGTFCVVLDGKPISYYPGDTKQVRRALEEKLDNTMLTC
jgi:N-acetylglutamate synthase-like GNAT family acetyltransferase